ncbi:Nup84p subcomplex of the nuclear pore complex subunit [Komagataella phaffii CBS 7435]|uniref:Nuclear pore complex protein n=2 Tax=Komagataella phaffii TaxID=460519 RepID=C4R6E7_KOMPG|nr:Subunit of the nuclear pore complex (NPC) [Komagataella phaffii GS115]AOA64327.1 GQ67_04202T0 [Komagataella phaffii]CAH2449026.1 Nup84p subcomplex of the nuclear pore complex subunit [Komagataella phaffii CBS 7435]AOA68984.1 GQ68_04175T0 [Komagataella phaffii GS115]CAY71133.1 Subunit of the nuclear pore complex (NPC) [Komagataella phaffii GS115]CCA39069.1 Nup84p subcomplex of the nuclear pore complex subunit [Komagataella phaffii CBS 7435]
MKPEKFEGDQDTIRADVWIEFSKILKRYRLKLDSVDLFEIVSEFKRVCSETIIEADREGFSPDILENWILETKFWNLVEMLIKYRFFVDFEKTNSDTDVNPYRTDLSVKEQIISANSNLKELMVIISWLTQNFNLDLVDRDPFLPDSKDSELQANKWFHTRIDIQSNEDKPTLVRQLDADAPLRGKDNNRLNEKDVQYDSNFFERVFRLLLEGNIDEISQLCKETNNWSFALVLRGLKDFIDPELNGSFSRDDDEDIGVNSQETKRCIGIKNRKLWRKTVYQLSLNEQLTDKERGVYGYMCGSHEVPVKLTNSWDRQLLIYCNNILQHDMEIELERVTRPLTGSADLQLPLPPKKHRDLNDTLNALASSNNPSIREQSQHSIRVLSGSLITNSIGELLKNSSDLLNEMITGGDESKTEADLIKESYLLRILVHLAIFMRMLDDSIISGSNLNNLIKVYIARLSLYKQYDSIPVYISFISTHADTIETYTFILSSMITDKADRLKQLKEMRELELPLETIVKRTVQRVFEATEYLYSNHTEIIISADVSHIDYKLMHTFDWFVDADMSYEALDAIIVLMRRFLLNGKVAALVELHEHIAIQKILDDYKLRDEVWKNHGSDLALNLTTIPEYKLMEVSQYLKLVQISKQLHEYEYQGTLEEPSRSVNLINSLTNNLKQIILSFLEGLYNPPAESEVSPEDKLMYQELRELYIPIWIDTLFDILVENRKISTVYVKEAADVVNLIADETNKFYYMLLKVGKLEPFLQKFALITTDIFDDYEDGIFV